MFMFSAYLHCNIVKCFMGFVKYIVCCNEMMKVEFVCIWKCLQFTCFSCLLANGGSLDVLMKLPGKRVCDMDNY